MSDGIPVRVGAVVSTTVTPNEPEVEFPAVSVAEQLTVVAPRANVSPEAWSQLTETRPSTMSLAEVANVTLAPAGPVASAVWSVGRTREGAVVSLTVTWNEPDVVRPPPSVTLQFTVVVPRAKVEPDAGAQGGVGAGASSASVA